MESMYMNVGCFAPITSTSQIRNVASVLDLVNVSGQNASPFPRVSGTGKDQVVDVAVDFDDTMEIGE